MFTFIETHSFQNAMKCRDPWFFLIQLLTGQLPCTFSTQYFILHTVCLSDLIYQLHSLLHHYPYSTCSACEWEKVTVSFLTNFSHEISSHYNSKSSDVWNLSSLEHFYLQNNYLTIFETSVTSLSLTYYSAFGTFWCLMLQRKFGKSCNVFKHLGNLGFGEYFPSWTTQINGLWFKDETDQPSELCSECIYAVHHAVLAGTFT